ncbi:MAG: hypothetical protein JWM33_1901 [Caulobacteraceae bacterium]|nr:hypothetical protein [Caulobacteraceae bacterium]
MEFECFPTHERPPEMVPGKPQRGWMDHFRDRHAYRCLPLTMANTTGWELLCPFAFTATWNGGPNVTDISIKLEEDNYHPDAYVRSHFSQGVLTFHPGYLFRTPPGWSMICSGPPNLPKDGIQPLVGIIETEWLPFPFTMNWLFTRPGTVRFAKSEPFCFLSLVQDKVMEDVQPVIKPLAADAEFNNQYVAWYRLRDEFNTKLANRDPAAVKEAWQKLYFQGQMPEAATEKTTHVNKRRLKRPINGA